MDEELEVQKHRLRVLLQQSLHVPGFKLRSTPAEDLHACLWHAVESISFSNTKYCIIIKHIRQSSKCTGWRFTVQSCATLPSAGNRGSFFFFFLKHLLASLQCPCCKLPHGVFVLQLTEYLNYVSIHIRARGVLVDAVCDFHPSLEEGNRFCECV